MRGGFCQQKFQTQITAGVTAAPDFSESPIKSFTCNGLTVIYEVEGHQVKLEVENDPAVKSKMYKYTVDNKFKGAGNTSTARAALNEALSQAAGRSGTHNVNKTALFPIAEAAFQGWFKYMVNGVVPKDPKSPYKSPAPSNDVDRKVALTDGRVVHVHHAGTGSYEIGHATSKYADVIFYYKKGLRVSFDVGNFKGVTLTITNIKNAIDFKFTYKDRISKHVRYENVIEEFEFVVGAQKGVVTVKDILPVMDEKFKEWAREVYNIPPPSPALHPPPPPVGEDEDVEVMGSFEAPAFMVLGSFDNEDEILDALCALDDEALDSAPAGAFEDLGWHLGGEMLVDSEPGAVVDDDDDAGDMVMQMEENMSETDLFDLFGDGVAPKGGPIVEDEENEFDIDFS